MSQPDYPLFSKRLQRGQRSMRGAYNFEKTKEYQLAEKWFEERRESKKDTRPPSPMVQSPPPIKVTSSIRGPPPGLPKPITRNYSTHCLKCNSLQSNPIIVACCGSCFCLSCTVLQAEVYNRCFKCNSIIDINKYKEYEDLDLKIPSYDEFDYISPDDSTILTHIPLNTAQQHNCIPESTKKSSWNIFAEEFRPRNFSDESQSIIMDSQLYTNYILFYNLILSCLQNQVS